MLNQLYIIGHKTTSANKNQLVFVLEKCFSKLLALHTGPLNFTQHYLHFTNQQKCWFFL